MIFILTTDPDALGPARGNCLVSLWRTVVLHTPNPSSGPRVHILFQRCRLSLYCPERRRKRFVRAEAVGECVWGAGTYKGKHFDFFLFLFPSFRSRQKQHTCSAQEIKQVKPPLPATTALGWRRRHGARASIPRPWAWAHADCAHKSDTPLPLHLRSSRLLVSGFLRLLSACFFSRSNKTLACPTKHFDSCRLAVSFMVFVVSLCPTIMNYCSNMVCWQGSAFPPLVDGRSSPPLVERRG